MPPAFYRVGDGHYVSGDHYENLRAADGVDLPDRSQATILFPANNGRSLMSGRQMAVIAPDAFDGIRQQEGLPESVARLHDSTPPRALVYLERTGELLSPDNARRQLGGDNLLEQVPEQHVFLSNFQRTGRQTGNLSNATAYRERNPEELRERLSNDVAGANREEGLPGTGVAYAAAAQPQLAEARQPTEFPAQAARAMPPAFYRVSEGRYVDVDHYETLRADPDSNLPARSEAAILFPADAGRTLMSGREMARHNYQEFADIRRQEGLPGSVQQSHDNAPPTTLVYVEETRELLSPHNARLQLRMNDVLENASAQHVFLSDVDGSGRQTGNFTYAPQSLGTENPGILRRHLEDEIADADARAAVAFEELFERWPINSEQSWGGDSSMADSWQGHIHRVQSWGDDVSMDESLEDDVSMAESLPDDDIWNLLPQAIATPQYALPMAAEDLNRLAAQQAAQQQVEIPIVSAIPLGLEGSRPGSPATEHQAELPLANARIIGTEMDNAPIRDDLRGRKRSRERDGL